MASTPSLLIPAKDAETSLTTQYTAVGTKTIISKLTATNQSASVIGLDVHLVTPGDSASSTNRVIKGRQIATGQTMTLVDVSGHLLLPNGFIATVATASGLTIICTGDEIS